MMKSKRETINSLFRNEIAHGSTVNEDADWSMVEGALVDKGLLGECFLEAADLESCSHG